MKNSLIVAILIVSGLGALQAQTSIGTSSGQTKLPLPSAYGMTSSDANSSVWQRTAYELDPTGQVVPRAHQYVEMASGLNHLVKGLWVESIEKIDVLNNGTAAATNGQHQAYFPSDIYEGQIELATPGGQHLLSRPLSLSYFDGTNTVAIAELTNSTGVVVGDNQVIYTNAFTGFKVDLRYTYTKGGFEQDIILRQQPPTPESFGLNSDTARLQVLTEFFNPPQPTILTQRLPAQAGIVLMDQSLGFDTMQMVLGQAFLMGQNAKEAGALVSKHWLLVQGRQFLMEEVPVDAILQGLASLPLTAFNSISNKTSHIASKNPVLPPQRFFKKNHASSMMLAVAKMSALGYVLDYQTLISSQTNYTFQSDSTYLISGTVSSLGTNTFEGGVVLKFATNGSLQITPGTLGNPSIVWKGGFYRPVVFTAKDDDTVGEAISGSSGTPAGSYYGKPMLNLVSITPVPTFDGLRMSFAQNGISLAGASASIFDAQFVNCSNSLSLVGSTVLLGNVLLANSLTNIVLGGGATVSMQNATIAGSGCLAMGASVAQGNSISLTNCILNAVSSLTNGVVSVTAGNNGFYSTGSFGSGAITAASYPFQIVGGGKYYLTNGCNFINYGTTNINSSALAGIRIRTTLPPLVYSNQTLSFTTNFSPQASRDTDTPDLGYHYDPLDYVFGGCTVNSNITFTAGTAVAWFRTTAGYNHAGQGIVVGSNQKVLFDGTAIAPTYLVRTTTVQEGNGTIWTGNYGQGAITSWTTNLANTPTLEGRFLHGSELGLEQNYFCDDYGFLRANFKNCEFWTGALGNYACIVGFTNCLMDRVNVWLGNGQPTNTMSFTLRCCTLKGGYFSIGRIASGPTAVSVRYSAFDNTTFTTNDYYSGYPGVTDYDYNSFLYGSGRTTPNGLHDVTVTNSYNWQMSWLGNYYQPSNSPLVDRGDLTADQIGLYHFTTQTNQVKEGNSKVDLGYHYVATDNLGNPLDSNGDGVADYIQDANGNGLTDSGESAFGITITYPGNGSTIY